jgi:hypothetical protein
MPCGATQLPSEPTQTCGERIHQHPRRAFIGDQVVAGGIDWIEAALARPGGDGLAGELRRVRRDRDTDRVPILDSAEIVEPVRCDLLADARAVGRIGEPRLHLGKIVALHPARQQILQRIARRRIGILVAIDRDAGFAGAVQALEKLAGAAPIIEARELHMHDLHMNPRRAPDGDRLVERVEHRVRLVAQMGEIAPAFRLHDLRQRDHLVGGGKSAGRREKAGRETIRSRVERLGQKRRHCLEFLARGVAIGEAHDHQPQCVVADQRHDIGGSRRKAVEVIGKALIDEAEPRRARREVIAQQGRFARQHRRAGIAAMADDFGGDALADLALRLGIERQGPVGMRLDVDKARRDHQAARIDHPRRLACDLRRDRGNAAIHDGDIGRHGGRAAAVDDIAAANDNVSFGHGTPFNPLRPLGREGPFLEPKMPFSIFPHPERSAKCAVEGRSSSCNGAKRSRALRLRSG